MAEDDAIRDYLDLAAIFTSGVPWCGAVSRVLGGVATERKFRRIEEVLKGVAEDLAGFKSRASEEYVKTEDFNDLLEETLRRAARERSEERRRFTAVLSKMSQHRPPAVVMIDDTLTTTYREIFGEFVMKNRLPAIMGSRAFAESGGLISYGTTMTTTSDLFRRAAGQVDKILGGAKPADLPVEQPTKFVVINLKTAKALGLTIPQTLLLRADQVIE